jgi:hypothetical protein
VNRRPVLAASSAASERECCDEYADGIDTPCTAPAPRASTAIAAHTAESIPPESPSTTEAKPFLRT